ncbi:hypothetical protein C8J57DRAFT_1338956 [Mycena rebaudengoi]|nr:hypothetical protein C8J57DRAFT_1338956 [Mycena rebaudengoi]
MDRHLPDEILSEILLPALLFPDELFCDPSAPSVFAETYSGRSPSAYLLVSKSWLRVATPLLYNVIVLRSKAQASALHSALRANKSSNLGRFIKKLRIEGGFGAAMHTILQSAVNVTDLFLSVFVWSSDPVSGLRTGLPLINPRRVIFMDHHGKIPENKYFNSLLETVALCIKSHWSNLGVCDVSSAIVKWAPLVYLTLGKSQTLHTVLLSASVCEPRHISKIIAAPALKLVQIKPSMDHEHEYLAYLKLSLDSGDPRIKTVVRFLQQESVTQTPPPDITPSLNPFFTPMEGASQETRDGVWNRIFSFAMFVEEPAIIFRQRFERLPSLIPFLLISKALHKLALPYMYRSPSIKRHTIQSFAKQLHANPTLGASIRRLYLFPYLCDTIDPDLISIIFRHAHSLEKVQGFNTAYRFKLPTHHDLDDKDVFGHIPYDAFMLLGQVAGSTLRTLTIRINPPSANVDQSPTVLALFIELRSLALAAHNVRFYSAPDKDYLPHLERLRLHECDPSLITVMSNLNLPALRSLTLSQMNFSKSFELFFGAHGHKLLSVEIDSNLMYTMYTLGVFNLCSNLKTFTLHVPLGEIVCTPAMRTHIHLIYISCNNPHIHFTKLVIIYPNVRVTVHATKDEEAEWRTFIQTLNLTSFPALQEIQITRCVWPTNERDISRSVWSQQAEFLLEKGVKLKDQAGKHWIPRLKKER